jgi:protein-S-isoprenylcysteine O-methyltransferase Ste14
MQRLDEEPINLKETILPLIMLAALFGLVVMTFNFPVGIHPKAFGAWVFGTILLFGCLNLVLVFFESRQNDDKED